MAADFPYTPEDVTKNWLASCIGALEGINESAIDDFSLSQVGAEQGASARVYRADIQWRNPKLLPRTLIFKFASDSAEHRLYAKTMGTYLKEVRFYQQFGAREALPIPHIFFSEIDLERGYFLIVMEDLEGARMSQWFGDSTDDVQLALEALAAIHAQYWGDEALDKYAWLGRADGVNQCQQYKTLLEQLLPAAKQTFGSLLSDYSWSVLDAWLENWESVRLATSIGTKTLVHREADMRQMFFPTELVPRFVLFDWQSPEIGWGAIDVCRMIATSFNLTERRRQEHSLVKLYSKSLSQFGVVDLPVEVLWHQIKLSLLMNVLAHMFSLLWVETKETDVWQKRHLGFLGAALEDWQLLEVIEALNEN